MLKRTPTEVRRALAYVLLNIRKHYRQRRRRIPPIVLDGASSGVWFDGWRGRSPPPGRYADPGRAREVAEAGTWLLRVGWRRVGLEAREVGESRVNVMAARRPPVTAQRAPYSVLARTRRRQGIAPSVLSARPAGRRGGPCRGMRIGARIGHVAGVAGPPRCRGARWANPGPRGRPAGLLDGSPPH